MSRESAALNGDAVRRTQNRPKKVQVKTSQLIAAKLWSRTGVFWVLAKVGLQQNDRLCSRALRQVNGLNNRSLRQSTSQRRRRAYVDRGSSIEEDEERETQRRTTEERHAQDDVSQFGRVRKRRLIIDD
ncbi:unnamed protein product [Sphagnum balticum]